LTDLTLIICYIHNGDASTQDYVVEWLPVVEVP